MNIRHSSSECRWGTSVRMMEVERRSLFPFPDDVHDGFDIITVDPFSEPEFNRNVGARRILDGTSGLNGYKDRWLDEEECPRADHILAGYPLVEAPALYQWFTAHVNPPGDELGDNAKRAWRLLDTYHRLGWFRGGACWAGFSLNQLQTLQGESDRSPLHSDFVRVIPAVRERFIRHSSAPTTKVDKKTGKVVDVDDAPSHPSFYVLLPAADPKLALAQVERFSELAGALGEVF